MKCIIPKITFVFLLFFFSSFISFKSVGTKEMAILHCFLPFLTISQRKRHHNVCKSSNMHSELCPTCTKTDTRFSPTFTDFENEVFGSNLNISAKHEPNYAFYGSKSKLSHCKLKTSQF